MAKIQMSPSAMADSIGSEQDTVAKRRAVRELIAFFALTFAITFGLGAAVIFFRPQTRHARAPDRGPSAVVEAVMSMDAPAERYHW